MPTTIFSDKQFQTTLKEWTRDLEEHPELFQADGVVQVLATRLKDVSCAEYYTYSFSSQDKTGMKMFFKFTQLFLETHHISEEEATTLDETINRTLPINWKEKNLLKQQILASETFTAPSKETSIESQLHKQITTKQVEMTEHTAQLKEIKRKDKRNVTLGSIGTFVGVASLFTVLPLLLAFTPLAPIAAIGIALGVAIAFMGPGLFLVCKEENNVEKRMDILDTDEEQIKALLKYRTLVKEEPFTAFMERIGSSKFQKLYDDPKKIGPLFQLYELEKQELEIRRQIAEAEQKTALASEAEQLKVRTPLNRQLLECIEKEERLRAELAV
ncbi:MAG: hypothetical protein ACK5MA_01660 [Parachlamydiaceae bacterium]